MSGQGIAGSSILVAAFNDEAAADEALKAMKQAKKEKQNCFEDVATTSNAFLEYSEKYISRYDAKVMTHELGEDIAAALQVGKDVAYTASATEEGVVAAKVTADNQAAELMGIDAPEEGKDAGEEKNSQQVMFNLHFKTKRR